MANKIILKKTSTASKVPLSTDLEVGEIAVNLADQKLYSKNAGGTVILVGSGGGGSGDVVGPASATDNALVRFDSTTGKLIQNGTVTQDDNGTLANVNAISLDTTPTSAPTSAGSIYWDSGNQTPTVVLNANTDLQLGQENIALVYNGTGATIAAGSVVAVNGAQGQRPSVALADADSEALSAPTLGIATESIANGAEGFVTTFGFVRGINTSAFTAGAPIYLSQTAGAFTSTRPSAPAHTVALGWVIKVNASSGEVFVNINNGWELDELHNVLITSPASGNTLIYDATAGVWKNANLTDGTGISIAEGAGSITVTNTAPDQVVALTQGGATTITGTYPNFTISSVNTTYSAATSTTLGLIELNSDTVQTVAANAVTATASRTYGLQVNSSGQGVVNVPWTDTNSGGTVTSVGGTGTVNGLTLTGTVTTTGNLTLGGTLSGTASSLTVGAATNASNLTGGNITGNMIVANATSPNSYYLQFGDNTGWVYRFMTNVSGTPTVRFSFQDNGAFTAVNNITAYSDERLKKNWRPVQENFIEKLAQIKSGIYDRTDMEVTQAGVSAQDMQKLLAETVQTGEDGILSLAYGNAAMVSVVEVAKMLMEMQQRIEFLESKLKD